MAKIANVLKLALQSESIAELKHAVVKTVENLVHNTLSDWENQ